MDVFDRMHKAHSQGEGVVLSPADLHLLYDLAGKALAKASHKVDVWQERFREYQLAEARQDRQGEDINGDAS